MSPGPRKLALATHLSVSVGWIGAVAGYLVLDLTVAMSQDPLTVRAAWIGMDLIVSRAILPLALASLVTGLIMALATKWGLVRHWWVLISFLLTVVATVVLASETGAISATTAIAVDPTTTPDQLLALPATLPHSIGGLVVLLVVLILNVYKPPGLTRYGWRKQQQEREHRSEPPFDIDARSSR